MSADHIFAAMGTGWWIRCDLHGFVADAEALVRTFERRLSRFRADSSLTCLNRDRATTCATLAAVTRAALRLQRDTDGAFDPTLGRQLCALGYDRPFDALAGLGVARDPIGSERATAAFAPTRVEVDGDRVTLDGPGDLDLGGIAKGWTVDRVIELALARGARAILVDGGGDLRGVGGPWPIGVGDDLVASTAAGAIATSSTLERRWCGPDGLDRHHIVDPWTGVSAVAALDTATVIAPDAATADALATALLVDPVRLLPRLPALRAHALVRAAPGRWWITPGAPVHDVTFATPAARP